MTLSDLTDPQAVESALAEFDSSGRDAFLATHGFRPSHGYFLQHQGKAYDPKAIAGVAHGYQHGTVLPARDFSGGEATVAARLEQLGFTVTRPQQLPDWAADEPLLALDLYRRNQSQASLSQDSTPVTDLSRELRALRIFPEPIRSDPDSATPPVSRSS